MVRVSFVRRRSPLSFAGRVPSVLGVLAVLAVALAAFLPPSPAAANPKYAAIVIDATTGRTLFARHADARRYPASLTKVMTLYIVFEEIKAGRLTLDTPLEVSAHAAARPPSKLGLPKGSTIRVEDAIKALVTKSANDVAVVVAENIEGSESAFAKRMTRTARRLGMRSTTFRNASGLPDDRQVTTARDMARLGIAVQRDHPHFYGYFALRSFTYKGRSYRNHNRLLGRVRGVDGIKTGFIRASGFNLLSSVRRNDRHIVAVVMGGRTGRTRNAHMTELITEHLPKAATGAGPAPVFLANRPVEIPRPKPYGRVLAAVIERSMVDEDQLGGPDPDAIIEAYDVAAIRRSAVRTANEPPPAPVPRTGRTVADARGDRPRRVETVRIVAAGSARGGSSATAQAYAADPDRLPSATRDEVATLLEYGSADTPEPVRPVEDDLAAVPSGWHIQIAAADSRDGAESAIERARARFPELLEGRDHATMRVETRTATLWRARFVGFDSKGEANAVCARLKRRGLSCWAEAM